MKIETRVINSELTFIGNMREGKIVELSKHYDYSNGKKTSFWRVDVGGRTISALNRTKADATKAAKKYINENWK